LGRPGLGDRPVVSQQTQISDVLIIGPADRHLTVVRQAVGISNCASGPI
jgi:hypothetical protein